MNSLDKVDALATAMVVQEEEMPGMLGMIQAAVAAEKAGLGGFSLLDQLPDDPAAFDSQLLDVAGFILWLRSDDAPPIDVDELVQRIPADIAKVARDAGLVSA